MELPKTQLEDFLNFNRDINTLYRWFIQGRISTPQFHSMRKDLEREYQDKLHPQDRYIFEDLTGLTQFLKENNNPSLKEIIEHEEAHGSQAQKLGYAVKYGYQLFNHNNKLAYIPLTYIEGNVTFENLKRILEAPSDPNEGDKATLISLRSVEYIKA